MKKLKLLLLLPVFVILVSGCTMDGGAEQAQDVFEEAMNNSAILTTYTASYSMNLDMTTMGQSYISLQGAVDLWQKLDKSKMYGILNFAFLGQQQQISMYMFDLPEGSYACIAEEATCVETEQVAGLSIESPDETFEMLQQLVDEGVVTLSYLGPKSLAGRTCDNVKVTINPQQIPEMAEIPEDMMTPEIQQALQNANMYYTICLDQETGMTLEYLMSLSFTMQLTNEQTGGMGAMTVSTTMIMQMIATAFSPNTNIPDSVFELPYAISTPSF